VNYFGIQRKKTQVREKFKRHIRLKFTNFKCAEFSSEL